MTKRLYLENYFQSNAASKNSSLTEIHLRRDDSNRSLNSTKSGTAVDIRIKKDDNRSSKSSKSSLTVDTYLTPLSSNEKEENEGLCARFCCFNICSKKKSPEELHKILHAGARRMSQTATPLNAYFNQTKKTDSKYFETGYLIKPDISGDLKSMKELRKTSQITSNLPEPDVAISNSNSRRAMTKGSKKVVVGETNVHEINLMLKSRLSGALPIDTESVDEKGEALLKCNRTGKDYTSALLSHLVNESETRRMSFHSDRRKSNFRSSFSKFGVDLKVENTSVKTGLKPEEMSDNEFLNKLTEVSTIVKNELEKDWSFTQSYIRTLDKFVKMQTSQKQSFQMGSERWMVILYTTSEELDDLTNFRCLLTRLILQQHHIAYEERDIALTNVPYKEELQKRLDTNVITVPYVFAYGVTVGNCQVIYALHKMKMIDTVFKNFVMPANQYAEWLTTRHLGKGSGLKIDVKVSSFPALNILAGLQTDVKLSAEDAEKTKMGKEIVRKARAHWAAISKKGLKQPDLLKFVLLKRTIILALTMMNDVYQNYLTKKMIVQHSSKKRRFSWMK